MKKLINDVELAEEQMILGMVKSAPHKLKKLEEEKFCLFHLAFMDTGERNSSRI